ncbi:putative 3-hydroxyacyl-CoA dehydrogenase [Aulographum hederae CBS 113979]|uniref:Putative 3-hydroxyacyl-CoA dehydrogenase n=1 Tax=Aulographum hederae CBS 113979 TaxID=1176131 RepID=A0A6G1GV46_9PEZI|nr:putative 3-hydroxyacyl-CoA dehydrogenase [Aulographum hederae CBS 113979]
MSTETFSTDGVAVKPDSKVFLPKLADKVIVLTGGASGIGAAVIELLYGSGACTVFGDVDKTAGEALENLYVDDTHTCRFVQMDASSYADNVRLFKSAYEQYGRVDHAISIAGVLEKGNWFDAGVTRESVETPDTDCVVDVNLMGTLYFSRVAVPYLRDGMEKGENKSLLLLSSSSGFGDSPALPVYQASKHGIMGLLRSLKNHLYPNFGVRVNSVCPGVTDTKMAKDIIDVYKKNDCAVNSAELVAEHIVSLLADEGSNGKAVFVEGGKGWEFQQRLDETMKVWLGKEAVESLARSSGIITKWDKEMEEREHLVLPSREMR